MAMPCTEKILLRLVSYTELKMLKNGLGNEANGGRPEIDAYDH
jgi:hypothetical protein